MSVVFFGLYIALVLSGTIIVYLPLILCIYEIISIVQYVGFGHFIIFGHISVENKLRARYVPILVEPRVIVPILDNIFLIEALVTGSKQYCTLKSQRRWGVKVRVLEKTRPTVRARGGMYKAVAQSVLLYGSNSWVVNKEMIKLLTAFHHRLAQRIMRKTGKLWSGVSWGYPTVEEAMESAGIHPI